MDEVKDVPEVKKPKAEKPEVKAEEVKTDGKIAVIKNGVTRRVGDAAPYLADGWSVK